MAVAVEPLSATRPAPGRPSWNPFRVGGTELPPHLLLMAKLIAAALLLTNHVRLLPDPFLPFLPVFDWIPWPRAFQLLLQVTFVASAVALLFNRRVRLNCLLLGAVILVGVISSKAYYGNNKTFCGLLLVLAGLHNPGSEPWLMRWQVALVYFGASLNKLLDADWQSGLFFDYWAGARLEHPLYLQVASWFPPLVVGKFLCWTTIVTELAVAAAFLVPRLYLWGIWGSVLFQSSLLLFTGTTFTMFFYGMQAAMLVFAVWPKEPLKVIYDGDCGLCNLSKRWFEKFDLEDRFLWLPWQSGAGRPHGVTDEAAQWRLHLVESDKVTNGFVAFQRMLLFNPVTYLAMALAIALPPADWSNYRRLVVAALLVFFFPLFNPIGQAVYDLVARNRTRIIPGSKCEIR